MTRALGIAALLSVGLAVGLAVAEVASRVLIPIRTSPFLDAAGQPIDIRDGEYRLIPSLRVKQVTEEFTAIYTTTPDGNRVPSVAGNPDLIFIGDSFTFGFGVSDHETFVALFCGRRGFSCANLGRVGTGTRKQLEVLEHYLRRLHWRPRRVVLMMFAMTDALMNGNDLTDNLREAGHLTAFDTTSLVSSKEGWIRRWGTRARYVLQNLNLVRVAMLYAGPAIRARFTPEADRMAVERALRVTQESLLWLRRLGEEFGFASEIILIHPMQDVMRGTAGRTFEAVRSVVPEGIVVHSTAAAMHEGPERFYYKVDMHLNARGHRAVASFLESLE